MLNDKILTLLGFASKAGKLSYGFDAVKTALSQKKSKLLLIANDISPKTQKEIMYFLEFGTGIVGLDNPHPKANQVGWEYIVNPENLAGNSGYNKDLVPSGYNSLGEYVGYEGWYYYDPETGELQFTSGLKAVSYIYDTMREENMRKIIERAKEMVKLDD